MASIKQQTLASSKWNFLDRMAVQVIQFVLGIIMARMLAPSDYGAIGILAVFFAISQSFIDSGFSAALIRKNSPTEEEFSTVFYFNFAVSLVAYGILFAIAPWVTSFFKIEILCPVLRVQAVTLIINAIMAVQVAMLNIRLDFKSLAKRNIAASFLSGVTGIILAYLGFGIWALVFQQIIAAVISLIFICSFCRWIPRKKFSVPAFKEMGGFGSKLLISGLLHTIYSHIAFFAIGKFYSAKDLGFYTRGAHYANLPNNTINGVLQTVTYPILAKIKDDEEHLISVYRKYIRITSMCVFIFSGLLCVLAKPIILFTLTEKWAAAIIFLQLFGFSYMFDHLNTINLNLLKVKGRSDLYLRLEIIKKTISVLILAISIPIGVLAICISKVIYNQIAVFINTYYTGKLFDLGYIQQFKDYCPFLIKAALACIPAYALTTLDLPNIATIIMGGCTSLLIYWYLLRNNPDMIELIDLVKTQFRKKNEATR